MVKIYIFILRKMGSHMENEVQLSKIFQTKLTTFPSKYDLFSVSCHWMAPSSIQLYKQKTNIGHLCNNQSALSHHPYLIHNQILLLLSAMTGFKLLSNLTESTIALSQISHIHFCPPRSYPPWSHWSFKNTNLIMSPCCRKSFTGFQLFLV